MPTEEELIAALRKADEAGDETAARAIAGRIKEMRNTPVDSNAPKPGEDEFGGNGFVARLRRGSSRFMKGVDRITSGDVSPQEFADAGENSVRSLTAPLGGDFVAAGAENITRAVTGQPNNPSAVRDQRERRLELKNRDAGSKLQSQASELLGFGGIQSRVTKLPGLSVLGRGTTIKAKAANTGRVAATAALDAGIGTTLQTGDVGEGAKAAVQSAVIAPAAGGTLGFVGDRIRELPGFVKSMFGRPNDAALRGLSKRVGVDSDTLQATMDEFRSLNGRPPTLAEISDPESIERMRLLASQRKRAGEAFAEAEELFAGQRPGELQAAIENGIDTQSVGALERRRDEIMTSKLRGDRGGAAGPLAQKTLDPAAFQDILTDPEVQRSLPTLVRARVARATDGEAPFNVDLMEQVRQALRGSNDKAIRDTGTAVGDRVGQLEPDYREAFDVYKRQSQYIDGFQKGEKVTTAKSRDFNQDAIPASEAQGRARGSRSALADQAGESATGAVRTASDLTEPGLRGRLATAVGEDEAERMASVGASQLRGAQNLRSLNPKASLPPSLAEGAEDLGELSAVALGRAGPFAIGRAIRKSLEHLENFGVPPNAARKMAEMFVDPNKSSEVIARMREIGVDEAVLASMVQDVSSIVTAESRGGSPEFRGRQE